MRSAQFLNVLNGGSEENDPLVEAFLIKTGITSTVITTALNNFVFKLRQSGILPLLQAYHPLVGGTPFTHQFNLLDPNTFTLIYSGGLTHNSDGITGDGVTGYIETGYTITSQNNFACGVYVRNNVVSACVLGSLNNVGSTPLTQIYPRLSGNTLEGDINQSLSSTSPSTDSRGAITVSRTGVTQIKCFQRSVLKINSSVASTGVTGHTLLALARKTTAGSASQFSTYNIADIFKSSGLTDTQCVDFNQYRQELQADLGRAV